MASPGVRPGSWVRGAKPTPASAPVSEQIQNVQARVVQHHYVRAELREINLHKGGKLVKETLDALKLLPEGKKYSSKKLQELFQHMTARLQTAELTINFKSPSWFMKPNTYPSYTQMYERAVRDIAAPGQPGFKQMRLKDDPLNPAGLRAATDDKVTFRQNMMIDSQFKPAYGGLGRVMSPGALKAPTVDAQAGELRASNPFFNPKSKQVFAALNYGRRPHGSAVTYGNSYMVLDRKFKTNAIYFAGDTFTVNNGAKVSADDQISYDLLGAIYGKANDTLRQALYKSCILDARLSDSPAAMDILLLLEAHLFEPLTFSGNLETLYISGKDKYSPTGDPKDARPITGNEWQTIQTNARAFAAIHGASVIFIE